MRLGLVVALLAPAAVLMGCAQHTIMPETKFLMAKPIDCRSAKEEMDLLVASRPDGLRRTMTAVQSVDPVGAVGGLLSNDYPDRIKVINGQHGEEIDRRLALLSSSCGLPTPQAGAKP
jgi:hypothetical protein